ncbi:hypothetical protein [Actinoallomurus sp. NPDC052274]|uniref:hypothetical protein n=1 Tax=Actinoallomurus sp. NPDC052274 TaxID=3155420 RepID=UPI0034361489
MRITTRNARFQQWAALLTDRTKRRRSAEFLVQGVLDEPVGAYRCDVSVVQKGLIRITGR